MKKNLVYVIGISSSIADEEVFIIFVITILIIHNSQLLRQKEYFG